MRGRRAAVAALTVAIGVGVGGCGSGNHATDTVVKQANVGELGPVLTTSSGMTLYMFPPDIERHVTCTGGCATVWPPLTVAPGGAPKAGPGVEQSLLGTDPDPSGGRRVVTYDGWPLYRFVGDAKPGQDKGQGLQANGGYWYVMAPTGQPLAIPTS